MLEIFGYFCATFVGITLGLIGAGGSILILPILVYLLAVPPSTATAYSLLIVGTTSLFGVYNYHKQKLVDYKTGFIFAFPAFLGVFLARAFIVPSLPEILYDGVFSLSKDRFILIFFATVMLIASYSMIRGRKENDADPNLVVKLNIPLIGLEGLFVGAITGFVGAGGGFLIIPALVVLAKIPMKRAIGTSLMIISIKSIFGVLGDYKNFAHFDWQLISIFAGLSLSGIFIGTILGEKIPGKKLKPAFGYFVVAMAIYIVSKELL